MGFMLISISIGSCPGICMTMRVEVTPVSLTDMRVFTNTGWEVRGSVMAISIQKAGLPSTSSFPTMVISIWVFFPSFVDLVGRAGSHDGVPDPAQASGVLGPNICAASGIANASVASITTICLSFINVCPFPAFDS